MSPRTGRPKTDNPMNDRLYVRVTKEEKEEIMNFSSTSGYSILEIIREGIKFLKGQKKQNVAPTSNQHNALMPPLSKRW